MFSYCCVLHIHTHYLAFRRSLHVNFVQIFERCHLAFMSNHLSTTNTGSSTTINANDNNFQKKDDRENKHKFIDPLGEFVRALKEAKQYKLQKINLQENNVFKNIRVGKCLVYIIIQN